VSEVNPSYYADRSLIPLHLALYEMTSTPTDMENQENSHKSNHAANGDASIERLEKGTVLIAGGGPVGLMLGTVLAHYGVKSIILERNESTTKLSIVAWRSITDLTQCAGGRKWTSRMSDRWNF